MGLECSKSAMKSANMRFFRFCQKFYTFKYTYFLQYESANGLLNFFKNNILS